MNTSAIILMLVYIAIIWGGFLISVFYLNKEK
ncbi:hypothetical protein UJ101_02641 [Flavobacteriaceae bacterium UJ101]|nr:hypothetical protein UJ101_02641 [Flavobacteriaceae bacterium UJ101]